MADLTDKQKAQIVDREKGRKLTDRVLEVLKGAQATFSVAEAWQEQLTINAEAVPAISVDVNSLIAGETNYRRLQDLVRNLLYYLGGVTGWTKGIGQPNHETYDALIARMKSLYPDADAEVKP